MSVIEIASWATNVSSAATLSGGAASVGIVGVPVREIAEPGPADAYKPMLSKGPCSNKDILHTCPRRSIPVPVPVERKEASMFGRLLSIHDRYLLSIYRGSEC